MRALLLAMAAGGRVYRRRQWCVSVAVNVNVIVLGETRDSLAHVVAPLPWDEATKTRRAAVPG